MIRYYAQYRVTGKNGIEVFRCWRYERAFEVCNEIRREHPRIGARIQRRYKRIDERYGDVWTQWERIDSRSPSCYNAHREG